MYSQILNIDLNNNLTYNLNFKAFVIDINFFDINDNSYKYPICAKNSYEIKNIFVDDYCDIYIYNNINQKIYCGKLELFETYLKYTKNVGINGYLFITISEYNFNESDPYSLHLDGSNSPTANINWNNHRITNLANPVNNNDGVNKNYVYNYITNLNLDKILKIDGTNSPVTDINWGNYRITNLKDPVNSGDIVTLKYFNEHNNSSSPPPPSPGNNGIFAGGRDSSNNMTNIIDHITITTTGSVDDFGDLKLERAFLTATSNGINDRAIFAGGYQQTVPDPVYHTNPIPLALNIIDYITISSSNNANNFGELYIPLTFHAATSNGTNNRGVFGGGLTHNNDASSFYYTNLIEYIDISTFGDSIFFGYLSQSKYDLSATSNGTNNRGVFGGGLDSNSSSLKSIEYITISSTGNAQNFGNLTIQKSLLSATSNGTDNRGVFGGGLDSNSSSLKSIEYITISSTSNAQNFGNLIHNNHSLASTSNATDNRGVFGGGLTDSIEYITISSTGNAQNFGNLTVQRLGLTATSNGLL